MDWALMIEVAAAAVGIATFIWSKISGWRKELKEEMQEQNKEMRQEFREQNARIDRLYQMFIDLLKEQKNRG